MSAQDRRSIRCAIYTRKSSEEGLEQSFNSLDAQREACQAYIQSQRQEGWRALEGHYDDGGYSGGSMDRPALKQLLADIEARKIDTVVVYKVDRLTRSLADFAKIIEVFDARQASFVSVTQQFNTTSSMGRLTLNVLLSFAQFEREVTGERIRDKIAASKRKGMWMGGNVPLGYDLIERHLVVNQSEADQVREIYAQYLKHGCVKKLKAYLDFKGAKSKLRTSQAGRTSGGFPYGRGGLYKILGNRIYLGEIPHKEKSFPGQHEAIISLELWDKVRARMEESVRDRRHGTNTKSPSLLRGILYDGEGNRLTPSHAVKSGKRYRYYTSQAVINDASASSKPSSRVPARPLENLVLAELKSFLNSPDRIIGALGLPEDDVATTQVLIEGARRLAEELDTGTTYILMEIVSDLIGRIVLQEQSIEVHLITDSLRAKLSGEKMVRRTAKSLAFTAENFQMLKAPLTLKRRSGELRLIVNAERAENDTGRSAASMIKAIARAHHWVGSILAGDYKDQRAIGAAIGVNERYVSHIISCAFLAPDIVQSIAEGRNVPEMTLREMLGRVPKSWQAQRELLGK